MGAQTVPKRLGDFDEGLKVFTILKEVMEPDGAPVNGKSFFKFKKGWSDARVAKETGYEENQIMRFRLKRKMLHKNAGAPETYHFKPHGTLQREITDLTAHIAMLEGVINKQAATLIEHNRAIAALDSALAALEDTITKPKAAE